MSENKVIVTTFDERNKIWVAVLGTTDGKEKDDNDLQDLADNKTMMDLLTCPTAGAVPIHVVIIDGIFCLAFKGNSEGGRYYNPKTNDKRVADTSIHFKLSVKQQKKWMPFKIPDPRDLFPKVWPDNPTNYTNVHDGSYRLGSELSTIYESSNSSNSNSKSKEKIQRSKLEISNKSDASNTILDSKNANDSIKSGPSSLYILPQKIPEFISFGEHSQKEEDLLSSSIKISASSKHDIGEIKKQSQEKKDKSSDVPSYRKSSDKNKKSGKGKIASKLSLKEGTTSTSFSSSSIDSNTEIQRIDTSLLNTSSHDPMHQSMDFSDTLQTNYQENDLLLARPTDILINTKEDGIDSFVNSA